MTGMEDSYRMAQVVTANSVGGAERSALAWLTVERALYGGLLAAALALRLAGLGHAPLLAEELPTALAAWEALQGHAPGANGYAPLLLDVQAPLFFLRSSALAVRLLPALAGALLVALPWLLRPWLGRVGALAAATLLAFSPGWVYAGRVADGALLSVALGAAFVTLCWRYLISGDLRHARWAAVALAAGLAAGSAIYTLLGGAALLAAAAWRRATAEQRDQAAARWRLARQKRVPALCALTLFALATGLGLNPGGLGAAADLAGAWVRALAPNASGLPWYHTPRALALYEPLVLLLAAIGAYQGLRRKRALEAGLLLWLVLALLLGTALGHREARWLLGALLPLTALAARGAQALAEAAIAFAPEDAAPFFLGLVLMGFARLQFAYYARTLDPLFAVYGGFALGILLLGLIGYGIWVRPQAAGRAALLLLGISAAAVSVRGTTALAFDRARDAWEPLLHRPASASLVRLDPLIESLSLQLAGDGRIVDVLYEEDLGPQIAWALRQYPNAQATVRVGAQPTQTLLITGPRDVGEAPPGYVGQRFALWEAPDPQKQDWLFWLRWLLYRPPGPQPHQEPFWVWARIPTDG